MGREDETFARDRMAHLRRTMADRARLDAGMQEWAFKTGYRPQIPNLSSGITSREEPRQFSPDEPASIFQVHGRAGQGRSEKINHMFFTEAHGLAYSTYEVNGHKVPKEDYERYKEIADSRPRAPGTANLTWKEICDDMKKKGTYKAPHKP